MKKRNPDYIEFENMGKPYNPLADDGWDGRSWPWLDWIPVAIGFLCLVTAVALLFVRKLTG